MQHRRQHQAQVEAFLQKSFGVRAWAFTLPSGSGNETYYAHAGEDSYFVKLGAHIERSQALSKAGVSPPVLGSGHLADNLTIMVQPLIEAYNPRPIDYQNNLEYVAQLVRAMHHDPQVKQALPSHGSEAYRDGALRALDYVKQQWSTYKTLLPTEADYVDKSLVDLEQEASQLPGAGLVAAHGDFCNANMLLTPEGRLYIIDLELMSLDDPALDLGAVLWWYYPPEMRRRFIETAGYEDTPELRHRMRVRMSLHCLCAALPRPTGFDTLDPTSYSERLADFRAVYEGKENPQGY